MPSLTGSGRLTGAAVFGPGPGSGAGRSSVRVTDRLESGSDGSGAGSSDRLELPDSSCGTDRLKHTATWR